MATAPDGCGDARVERGIMRVLLVEDDHAIVRALTDLLEGEGFAVRSCATRMGHARHWRLTTSTSRFWT